MVAYSGKFCQEMGGAYPLFKMVRVNSLSSREYYKVNDIASSSAKISKYFYRDIEIYNESRSTRGGVEGVSIFNSFRPMR